MWQSVICCLLAGLLMWIPDWFGVMNVLDAARSRRAVLFRCRDAVFRWRPAARWSRSPSWRARLARWSAVWKTLVPACWRSLSAMLPQTGQGSLGLLMTLMGLFDRAVLAAAGDADVASGAARLSARHRSIVISSMGERCCFIRSRHHPHMRCGVRIKRLIARTKHAVWRLLPSVRAQAMPVARLAVTARLRVFAATPFL